MSKIMLVEDDNNLREIYEARLLAEGYEIVSAKDGEEALAMAVKEKPDLIISDVMMPKISGFDMLDILRSTPETKNTKVIMMTALSQAEDKARADKLGADRYLVKSQVTLEDVAKVARDVLTGEEGGATPDPLVATETVAPVASPTVTPVTVAAAPEPPAPTAPADTPDPKTGDPGVENAPPTVTAPSSHTDDTNAPTSDGANSDDSNLGQTTASEEAAIDAQINDFVSKIGPTEDGSAPGPSPEPVSTSVPVDSSSPEAPLGSQPVEEIAVSQAPSETEQASNTASQLADTANEVLQPSAAPEAENNNVTINNKKIISPTGDMSNAPDLNALLEQEKEAEAIRPVVESVANPGATVPAPGSTVKDDKSPVQNPSAGNLVMPNSSEDPNNIAL